MISSLTPKLDSAVFKTAFIQNVTVFDQLLTYFSAKIKVHFIAMY